MRSPTATLTKCKQVGKSIRRTATVAVLVAGCALATACDRGSDQAASPVPPRTTDGKVFLHNLNGQIARWQATGLDGLRDVQRTAWIDALLLRFRLRLNPSDLRAAEQVSADWLAKDPGAVPAMLARVRTLQVQHRTRDAAELLDALDQAATDPAHRRELARLRCAQSLARGEYAWAVRCAAAAVRTSPGFDSWAVVAIVYGNLERPDDAAHALVCARPLLRGPSPVPLVWWHAQMAGVHHDRGQEAAARAAFERALDRMPQHLGVAREHALLLHAAGEQAAAVQAMRTVAQASGDPDALAWLALWTGQDADRRVATATYDTLMQDFPEAFRFHAAEFALESGDIGTALDLAQAAVADAPTISNLRFLQSTAHLAGRAEQAARARARIDATLDAVADQHPPRC